jgi:hypothetical protein
MAQKSLSSWSWKNIQSVYAILGKQLQEHESVRQRCSIPRQINIHFSDSDNSLILRFWRDVNRVEAQLQALDKEIARRNKLVGVI